MVVVEELLRGNTAGTPCLPFCLVVALVVQRKKSLLEPQAYHFRLFMFCQVSEAWPARMFLQHHGRHDLPRHMDSGTLDAETEISYSSNVCKHRRITGPNSLQSSDRYAVLTSVCSLLLLCTCVQESAD